MYKNKKSVRVRAVFIIIGCISIFGLLYVDYEIKPAILAIAEIKAKEIAVTAMNEATDERSLSEINFEDLILVETDHNGNVTFVQANTVKMNELASKIALNIQEKNRTSSMSEVKVPLGNVFGSQLLAHSGPKIKVSLKPIGMANVDFQSEFIQSGINQTIHRIYLKMTTTVRIIIPFSSKTVTVDSSMPVTETVIVGDVPQNYINVPEDEFLNVVPSDNN